MNRKAAGFLTAACIGAVLAGGYMFMRPVLPEQAQEENLTENEQSAESSQRKAPSADIAEVSVSDKTEEAVKTEKTEDTGDPFEPTEILETTEEETQEETREETQEEAKKLFKRSETGKPEDTGSKKQENVEPEDEKNAGEQQEEEKRDSSKKNRDTDTEKGDVNRNPSNIHIRKTYDASDVPPGNTVGFIPSRKEEIMEDRYIESVVDENDPSSYQIIKKEKTIPTLYVNNGGDIKYAYEDGAWYEYKYSNVNITLDTENEDLALLILNLDGPYDEYEVIHTDCKEVAREDGTTEYEFHVRYQGIFAMESTPLELAHLKAVDIGRVAATRTVVTEEKVPVMMQQLVGTGKYNYYGWQVLDGETFYFDQEGKKVTGSQVIRGIRHEFDENGVRTSRAGVEISEENGEIDWEKVSDAGVDFAVIRCAYRDAGDGRIVPDSRAEENIKGARAAGLEVMLSLFSQAVTAEEAVEEAETVINMARAYGLTMPVAVTSAGANPEHTGRADGLKPSERTACIHAFCQTIKEYGYTPVLHAEAGWMADSLCMEALADTPLWVAEYNTNLTYTGLCDFWQYTAKGTTDGISGYTGLIISYENRRDFQ